MVKVDLITGFLGSGKTTFLKKYAVYLLDRGENICILENDFGAVNVDMMLLQDLEGEKCELEMVSGGCDEDCHRRRFKTKLIAMGMCGYDRVLIEPSGIFDVDEFFDVLREEPLDRWYEIGNVFVIADATLERDLSRQSRYILASQLAAAGRVIFSRCQESTPEQMTATVRYMDQALEEFGCSRRIDAEVFQKDWSMLTQEDFAELETSGYRTEHCAKLWFDTKETFDSVYFMNRQIGPAELQKAAEQIFHDPGCGQVFRIKGFLKNEAGEWMELNATKEKLTLEPLPRGQEVLIVIGEDLDRDRIEQHLSTRV